MSKFVNLHINLKWSLLITAAALLSIFSPVCLLAQSPVPVYQVSNESELDSVLGNAPENSYVISLVDNVLCAVDRRFDILPNKTIRFDLNEYNIQGNGQLAFQSAIPGSPAPIHIIINGSTAGFNGGLRVHDHTEFEYWGVYTSTSIDILGERLVDDVVFDLTHHGSGWNATTASPIFIDELPTSFLDPVKSALNSLESGGTIVVGSKGKATLNVSNGNWVNNAETIVGARHSTGQENFLNISGFEAAATSSFVNVDTPTTWKSTGTLYVGFEGNGTANIWDRAQVSVGSIGVGIKSGSINDRVIESPPGSGNFILDTTGANSYLQEGNGTLNVKGISPSRVKSENVEFAPGITVMDDINLAFDPRTTRVSIFGRDDANTVTYAWNSLAPPDGQKYDVTPGLTTNGRLTSLAEGVMNITKGAIVRLDEQATETGDHSGYTPRITLGSGNSTVNNSLISGANRDWRYEETPLSPTVPVSPVSHVGEILGRDHLLTLGDSKLTFENYSVLQGSVKIYMDENEFKTNSIITPGYEKYEFIHTDPSDKKFGKFEFDNNSLTIDSSVQMFIDFDIHGNLNENGHEWAANHGSDDYFPADKGYLGDRGRDQIVVTNNGSAAVVQLDGQIYFRPQSGYYSGNTDTGITNPNGFTNPASGEIRVNFLKADPSTTIDYSNATIDLYPSRWFEDITIERDNSISGEEGLHLVTNRNTTPFSDLAAKKHRFNLYGVGGALDYIYNEQVNYDWLYILDWVWIMNDEELSRAMHMLSGESRASSMYMPLRSPWRFGYDRTNWTQDGRLYFGTQNPESPKLSKNVLWANAYYDYTHMLASDAGSSTTTQRESFMAGYDRAIQRRNSLPALSETGLGVVFGYSQPKLHQGYDRIWCDDFLVGAHFATRVYNRYEVKGWASVGAQRYHINRFVPVPGVDGRTNSKLSGNSVAWSMQAAMPYKFKHGVIRPFTAMDLNYVHQGTTLEDGDYDQIRLWFRSSDWTQLFGRVGARADYGWECLNFTAALSYSYQIAGHAAPRVTNQFLEWENGGAGGPAFRVQGNYPSRSFFDMTLGTQFKLDKLKNSVVFMQYNGSYGKYTTSQTAAIGYQRHF